MIVSCPERKSDLELSMKIKIVNRDLTYDVSNGTAHGSLNLYEKGQYTVLLGQVSCSTPLEVNEM